MLFFALVAVGVAAAGVRVLNRYLGPAPASDASTDPIDPSEGLVQPADSPL